MAGRSLNGSHISKQHQTTTFRGSPLNLEPSRGILNKTTANPPGDTLLPKIHVLTLTTLRIKSGGFWCQMRWLPPVHPRSVQTKKALEVNVCTIHKLRVLYCNIKHWTKLYVVYIVYCIYVHINCHDSAHKLPSSHENCPSDQMQWCHE